VCALVKGAPDYSQLQSRRIPPPLLLLIPLTKASGRSDFHPQKEAPEKKRTYHDDRRSNDKLYESFVSQRSFFI